MKNWLLAEFGSLVRAIEQTPRTCGSAENSCLQVRLRRAAGAVAVSAVAALGHEAGDDAVERHAVIEALVRQFADALNMVRREVRAELDLHRAGVEFERQGMKGMIDHQLLSLSLLRGTRAGI